jgi:hypothetical protein
VSQLPTGVQKAPATYIQAVLAVMPSQYIFLSAAVAPTTGIISHVDAVLLQAPLKYRHLIPGPYISQST